MCVLVIIILRVTSINGGKYVCEPDDMTVWGYGHTRKELLFLWPLYEFVTHITKHEANMISIHIL